MTIRDASNLLFLHNNPNESKAIQEKSEEKKSNKGTLTGLHGKELNSMELFYMDDISMENKTFGWR